MLLFFPPILAINRYTDMFLFILLFLLTKILNQKTKMFLLMLLFFTPNKANHVYTDMFLFMDLFLPTEILKQKTKMFLLMLLFFRLKEHTSEHLTHPENSNAVLSLQK